MPRRIPVVAFSYLNPSAPGRAKAVLIEQLVPSQSSAFAFSHKWAISGCEQMQRRGPLEAASLDHLVGDGVNVLRRQADRLFALLYGAPRPTPFHPATEAATKSANGRALPIAGSLQPLLVLSVQATVGDCRDHCRDDDCYRSRHSPNCGSTISPSD
jgi:hypothetical protein